MVSSSAASWSILPSCELMKFLDPVFPSAPWHALVLRLPANLSLVSILVAVPWTSAVKYCLCSAMEESLRLHMHQAKSSFASSLEHTLELQIDCVRLCRLRIVTVCTQRFADTKSNPRVIHTSSACSLGHGLWRW